MKPLKKILLYFVLPIIAPLLLPPRTLAGASIGIAIIVILFGFLGFLLLRGYSRALTLCIFLIGLNAIVRLMTFFPHATYSDGTANLMFIFSGILSIGLSVYLLLRLDQVDVRTQMIK